MKQYVIFDLDGTLLDTIADLADATNYALEQLGYTTHPITAYNYMVGNGVTKLLERALPEDMRTTRMVEAMRCHFLEYYDVHCTDRTTIYPGISDLLDELAACRHSLNKPFLRTTAVGSHTRTPRKRPCQARPIDSIHGAQCPSHIQG